jgi:hypothetical protein
MSSEERRKILQMVEEGKVTAQEAVDLMRALEMEEQEAAVEVIDPGIASDFAEAEGSAPEFEQIKARARHFMLIPLWVGILVTVLSAWGIYEIQNDLGTNYWWICLLLPLFLGILFIVIGAGGRSSRWLYVNVDRQRAGDWPKNITLAFPLPLGLTAWFLRNFGHHIEGLRHTNVDDIIQILEATKKSEAPLIVNVDDDHGRGERVQVYIG